MKKTLFLITSAGLLLCHGADFRRIDPLADSPSKIEKLPEITGSEEFTVELPLPGNRLTVNCADFGVSPEKSDNTGEFLAAIKAAKERGASRLVLPNGVYRFTSSEWLEFNGFTDFEFDGQGSTLVFWKQRDVPSCLINIIGCRRVRFANFKIDWDWQRDPIASAAEVEAVAPDRSFADFRLLDGAFPHKDLRIALIDQMTPDGTSGMGEGSLHFSPAGEVRFLAPDLLRIPGAMPEKLAAGQRFRISHYYGAYTGVAMSGNEHLTLQDIDMYSCPGFAFHAYDGQHHWQMQNVNIIRKPGTFRPITVSADHVHITKARGFFKMENCEMSFGNDDCFNVNDQSRTGIRSGEKTLRAANPSGGFFPGNRVEFRRDDYSPTGVTTQLVSTRPIDTPDGAALEMEFADPLPGRDGDRLILFNREQGSRNIILRNSYFHDNRAHGMRLQARDITVENCRFSNNAMGIAITTGYTLGSWCEGYGAENIVLRNNTFSAINTGNIHPAEKSPAVYLGVFLKSDPSDEKTSYPIINRILFENNRFANSPGVIAYLSSANNVVFRNNVIINDLPSRLGVAERGGIAAGWSSGLFFTGNRWLHSEHASNPTFLSHPGTVEKLQFHNNQEMQP